MIEYKYTKGSWHEVEKDSHGHERPNRMAFVDEDPEIIYDEVAWLSQQDSSLAAANTSIMADQFEIPQLGRKRRIWIYLPLNYADSDQRYPVLYMQDAQNLFDKRYTNFPIWGIDKTLNIIEKVTKKGIIVVGIDHGHEHRIGEYSPYPNKQHGGGEGIFYSEFLINTLKPYIDKTYRTLKEREHTGIGGSSMGGLISLYAGLKYADVFGKMMIFSPSLWYSRRIFEFLYATPKLFSSKIYLLGGSQEGDYLINHLQKTRNLFISKGYSDDDVKLMIRKGGSHTEGFWGKEFGRAYKWLFEVD
jgi:predicted alpha/beta superfamily hydrolase